MFVLQCRELELKLNQKNPMSVLYLGLRGGFTGEQAQSDRELQVCAFCMKEYKKKGSVCNFFSFKSNHIELFQPAFTVKGYSLFFILFLVYIN